jgi:hypothetical protein
VDPEEPADWPGGDAVRDGAPIDAGARDPRLIAAERVIHQLRMLLGAVVARGGEPVEVTVEELGKARVRNLAITRTSTGVRLSLPAGARPARAPAADEDPADENQAQGGAGHRGPSPPGDSALLRRLQRIAAEHEEDRATRARVSRPLVYAV